MDLEFVDPTPSPEPSPNPSPTPVPQPSPVGRFTSSFLPGGGSVIAAAMDLAGNPNFVYRSKWAGGPGLDGNGWMQSYFRMMLSGDREGALAEFRRNNATLAPGVEGTNNIGGYLVPTEWLHEVAALMRDSSVAMRKARFVKMNSNVLNIPTLSTQATVAWYSENSAIAASKPVYGTLALTTNKLGVIMPMSNELITDAVINLPQFLAECYADAASTEIDNQFFRGTGSPFTGLNGVSGVTVTYQGGSSTSAKTAYNQITWDDLITLCTATLPPKAMQGAEIYIDQNVWAVLLKTKASTGGDYFVSLKDMPTPQNNTDSAVQGYFMGYPVNVMPSGVLIATYDTSAHVSTKHVFFGNLSKTSWVGENGGLRVSISEDATADTVNAFTNDLKFWRFIDRLTLGFSLPSYIGAISTSAS